MIASDKLYRLDWEAEDELYVLGPDGNEVKVEEIVHLLNELKEENEHYKQLFFDIVETALTDKNCREEYCKGILGIFDKANSLNQARDMIKEHLE